MFERDKHPTPEKIAEFINMTKHKPGDEMFEEYLDMSCHMAECKKCRRIRQELRQIDEAISLALDGKATADGIEELLDIANGIDCCRDNDLGSFVREQQTEIKNDLCNR